MEETDLEKFAEAGPLAKAFGVDREFRLPEVELTALRNELANVRPYFILFTARSGSTFLTHEMVRAGNLSTPHEWFNWDVVRNRIKDKPMTVNEYIIDVVNANSSENKVFGCEINWLQLSQLNRIAPIQKIFPIRIKWFLLRRRNIVAQAISNFVADQSKIFHSYQLNDEATKKLSKVQYDFDAISNYVMAFVEQERFAISWLEKNRVAPCNLYYEDVTQNPETAAMTIANVVGSWIKDDYFSKEKINPITKIGGKQNLAFESKFRQEAGPLLAEIANLRPPIQDVVSNS